MFMFKPQKGIVSRALAFIGVTAIMFGAIIIFLLSPEPGLSVIKSSIIRSMESLDFEQRILLYLAAILLFFFGLYLTSIYPRILVTRGGLKYLGFILYYGQFRWNEIDGLFELKNGTILISINPRRFFLFRGMFFQRLTGVLFGHKRPVLLLEPGFELRDRIIQEIMANGPVKEIHKFGDSSS